MGELAFFEGHFRGGGGGFCRHGFGSFCVRGGYVFFFFFFFLVMEEGEGGGGVMDEAKVGWWDV